MHSQGSGQVDMGSKGYRIGDQQRSARDLGGSGSGDGINRDLWKGPNNEGGSKGGDLPPISPQLQPATSQNMQQIVHHTPSET